jgi:uncharacterized membrane protein
MMSRNRLVALALVALLLATSVASLSPVATAQDFVPTKPTIPLVPLPNLEQRFFLRAGEMQTSTAMDCTNGVLALTPSAPTSAPTPVGEVAARPSCTYTEGVGESAPRVFSTGTDLTPIRAINFTGNNTFRYHHFGAIPDGMSVRVEVRSGDTTLAETIIVGRDEDNRAVDQYAQNIGLDGTAGDTGRGQILAGTPLRVVLTAIPDAGTLDVSPSGWALDDTRSYLELRAQDAVRTATWVTDERDAVRDVFAPIANDSFRLEDEGRRIVGHFALSSAFGVTDAQTLAAPVFQVFHNGAPREVGPAGQTFITSVLNSSASTPAQGLQVWTFEPGTLNYRGLPVGDYAIRVEAMLHTGAGLAQGIEKRFAITSQSVTLAPFADPRIPGVVESQAHTVLSGASTTYLLAVTNSGSVNDNFTINVSAPNAAAGWGAQVGGPDVLSRRVFVPAGATRVFTLTVSAPFTPTGQVVHIVNVTSTIDPGTRSRELTLVTTIGTELTREVSIVFLPTDLSVEPGVDHLYDVFVWNRGTSVANVSLEVQGAVSPAWRAQLLFGNSGVGRLVVSGIPAGGIGEAQLRIAAPVGGTPDTQTVGLNATNQDVAGVSRDLALTFALRPLSGVRVQVLGEVNTVGHVIETSGTSSPTCIPRCDDDGVDGVWFRVWVTNTGRARDTFGLTLDSIDKAVGDQGSDPPAGRCTSTFFIPGTDPDVPVEGFGFFGRTSSGALTGRSSLTLEAGETGETYLFVPTDRTQTLCADEEREEDFFSFIVQAFSQQSQAVGRAPGEAIARDSGPQHGVFLENVQRKTAEVVDINNVTSRLVFGGVEPGHTALYRVRLTNLASWSDYTDSNGRSRSPVINVSLLGTEGEPDWNISMRQVLDSASNPDYDLTNPFKRSIEVSNTNPTRDLRREAWFDTEIEVRVEAPANGTAATKARAEFSLLAEVVGTGAKSTLEMATVIVDKAQIDVTASPARALAHPGQPGAFLLTLSNVGGSTTTVTMGATIAPTTPNANAWQVSPNAQTFTLAPFTNRTVALLVTPPPAASQGQSGEVALNITYFDRPETIPTSTAQASVAPLIVDVVAPGTLQLTTPTTDLTIPPSGTANFTMTVRNTGSLDVPFRVLATPIPNWTVQTGPETGTLRPGENRTVVLVLVAPTDVKNGTRFASVLHVEEIGAANNFDSAAFNVNVLGGTALPRISVPTLVKRVDRDGVQSFEVGIQNIGSAAGRLPLEVRAQDPAWTVGIVDARGENVTGLQLGPNELQVVNVTVRAPRNVPERAAVPIELIAYSQDLTQAAKATLTAEIHDYGVQIVLTPPSKEGLPGVPTEFTAMLKNTGNDNDTLNLSVNLVDLPEWSVDLSTQEIRLEPGQEIEVRATIRSPTTPLPAARAYTFPFWVGTRGGQEVDIPRNMTVGAVVTIPNYRAHDVDRDGQLEIAVDLDQRAGNGFEVFREVFAAGVATQVIANPLFEGRTTYFLDVPTDRPYDGVADVWFNPETVHAFDITHAPDVNGDGTPDYLLDTDRDGRIDKAFDSATERFWDASEISVFGDERIQYLVDITGDGRPDRFFDPETGRVTRTQNADSIGADLVGIDVDDDDTVDYYYNTRTRETSGAEVQNVGSFAQQYWYFFLVFAALVLLTVILVVRRRRA